MYTFADRLENLKVEHGRRAVVSVVLVFLLADDPVRTFARGQLECRVLSDARDDGARVEGEDRRVCIYFVGMQYPLVSDRLEDRLWQVRYWRERVFIRATWCKESNAGRNA